MTTADLIHSTLLFDPELDPESVKELPGKEVMQSVRDKLEDSARVTPMIQDSHGWCFLVRDEDGRRYLLELSYVTTEGNESDWVLSCARSPGWRLWEYFGAQATDTGQEREWLERTVEILISHHGFERLIP